MASFLDWPLRAKMAALFVAASLLPLGIDAIFDIREARSNVLRATANLLAARGDQLRDQLDTFNRGYQRSATLSAKLPDLIEFCQAGFRTDDRLAREIRDILAAQPGNDLNVRGAALLDTSGTVRMATETTLLGVNLSYQRHVREVLAGVALISDVHLGPAQVGELPTISYLAPVLGTGGKVIGVFALWVRAAAMWDLAKASNALAGPASFAVLFDHEGIRIAHTYSQEVVFHPGGPLDASTIATLVAERRLGDRTQVYLDDVRAFPEQFERARAESPDRAVFRGFAPVNQQWNYGVGRRFESVPWTVFYMIPEASLTPEISRVTLQRTVVAAVMILLALLAGTLFAVVMLKPIRALSTATESIAAGELDARVPEGRADELGRLGRSFNAMAGRIEAQASALQSAHDDLERRVDERTAELERTASELKDEIAERKQAEDARLESDRRRQFALELAQIGHWELDLRTHAAERSLQHDRIFGYDALLPEWTYQQFLEHVLPEDRPIVDEKFGQAVAAGRDWTFECRITRADGALRWISAAGRPQKDADGTPVRLAGIVQDITARRTLEAQFQQAQKMEAIGRLAGGIAHDFNNLLTGILGYCELLLEDLAAPDARRTDVLEIQKAATHAAGLTRQLLAFSRKQIIEPKRLDLNAIMTGMLPMLRRLIGEDITVAMHLAPDLAAVEADRAQMEQVVFNLAVNARDAMPKGGILTIETANVVLDEEYTTLHLAVKVGEYVVLNVSDTGTGMTPEVQARLFEPFFTTKEVGKGTGLGLATVHGIVTRSGGSVGVYSEVGKGTSFKVYFPKADAAKTVSTAEVASARPQRGGETVLLVEDAEGVRELATRLLRRHGYTVLVASTADEARRLFDANPSIDVILSDVVMPGASGPELTEQLVALRPGVKVVYMSGYTDETIVHHGVLNPGIAFLHKPFTAAALGAKLREVLD